MAILIDSKLYADYLKKAYERINQEEDYITGLDSATGDGDHWANLNKGYTKLKDKADELAEKSLSDLFKNIGMIMMAEIGGSSGVLYGGANLAAAKAAPDKEAMDLNDLYKVYRAMLDDIQQRGKAERGWKTMIDALAPAVDAMKQAIDEDLEDAEALDLIAKAAVEGAEATKEMEAVRGRATYQKNKGVGHLDPGAVTMAYQIETLCNVIKENL